MQLGKLSYRPDLDGLRALAVTMVLLYHTGLITFRGGFIGVDVFFVISGFLITSLLRSDLQRGDFSIAKFYERRVRRIFPALLAVVAATLVTAPFILFPVEIRMTALTAITALSSFSNIYLLHSSGYFGADVSSQPLIHTWSLGVEEQFYLAFPLLLSTVGTSRPRMVQWMIIGIAVPSLAGGILLTISDRDVAYYFPLTRAWELLTGSLLAYTPLPALPRAMREFLMSAALMLLVACSIKFHSGLPFPGYLAIAPCLAATILIGVGGQGPTAVKSLFSLAPLVWVGKISYSLYLWHWPIFVYYQLVRGTQISVTDASLLIFASVVVSYLSWRYIEQPFRKRKISATSSQLWISAAATYVVICVAAGVAYGTIGTRTPKNQADRFASFIDYDDRPVYRQGVCFIIGHLNSASDFRRDPCLKPDSQKPNILLVGDSHAADLWSGLQATMPASNVMQATSSGCKPVISPRGEKGCTDLITMVFGEFLKGYHPDTLVLSARWIQSDIPDLVRTIAALRGHATQIVVFGPIVEYHRPLARILAQVAAGRDSNLLVSSRNTDQRITDNDMEIAVKAAGAFYVSTYQLLCPNDGGICATEKGGVPLQWDYGHLTAEGSKVLADRILENHAFNRLLTGRSVSNGS